MPDLEEATDVVPEDSPYKEPYEEAKEADKLVDEDLEEVNSQITEVVDAANQEIEEANTAAGNAAGEANKQVEGVNQEIANANDAAKSAAEEANSFAEQAKDTALSLDERKEAAGKAEEAAAAAEAAARKADEQVTAAQNVVDTAQKALEDAERAYQNAVNEANQLLVGNETDPGLTVQAEELIAAAEAKVKSAQDSLGKAKAEFAAVEADRSGAWDASEAARIAADAAKAAADGQQEVIDTAKNDYGAGIYDKSKEDVDNGADAAISAKELENAAKDVVNAQTKVYDLKELDKLTTAKDELEKAKDLLRAGMASPSPLPYRQQGPEGRRLRDPVFSLPRLRAAAVPCASGPPGVGRLPACGGQNGHLLLHTLFDGQGAAIPLHLLRRVQPGKAVQGTQHVESHRAVPVVHGNDHRGANGVRSGLGPGGVNGVKAPYRNQNGITAAQLRQLLRTQRMAQISEVGHGDAAGGEFADHIASPQRAALVVVEGLYLRNGERVLPAGGQADLFGVAVVKVVVAAIDGVRLRLRVRQAGNLVVGVQQSAEAPGFQDKAGMAQPGDRHVQILPCFTFPPSSRRSPERSSSWW